MRKEKLRYEILNTKNNKGITLIALIITIIILLILVSVTVRTLLGDDGIINKTILAKEKYENATFVEKVQLIALDYYDHNKGGYNFVEMQEAIQEKYPTATFLYAAKNQDNNYIVIGTGNSDNAQILLPEYAEQGKNNLISCIVKKDDQQVTITNEFIREGEHISEGKWITEEEAQKQYMFSNVVPNENSARLDMYFGKDVNVKIPEAIIMEDGKIFGFATINEGAFQSYDSARVINMTIREYIAMMVSDASGKDINTITVQDAITYEMIPNSSDISTARDIKLMTQDTEEKKVLLSLFKNIGITEGLYEIKNGDMFIILSTDDGNLLSKNTIDRKMTSVIIPASIKTIRYQAVKDNKNLLEVTFLGEDFIDISSGAFEGCINLKTIKFPNLSADFVKEKMTSYTKAWGALENNINSTISVVCKDGTITVTK